MRRSALALCALAASATLAAQNPPGGPRVIQLPDTMGANFSVADSATAPGSAADFDFLVGLWEFRFQGRLPDGTFAPVFTGHWTAEKKRTPNGFIEDHWRGDSPKSSFASGTYTYRVFNPRRKIWEMQGVGSESGAWQPGLSWSDANNRYVIQHNGRSLLRIRYFNITDTSFMWRTDESHDAGVTWQRDFWTMTATRIGK